MTAHSQFNTAGKTKVRMGKLSGITTTTFGTLPGYGFYASGSAFLEGSINATAGEIGGFTINSTSISASNLFMKSSGQITGSDVLFDGGTIGGFEIDEEHISANSDKIVLDSTTNNGEIRMGGATNLTTGNGFYVNGNGSFRAGDAADNFIKKDGNGLQIKSDSITLDSSGNLTISGTLSSSVGNIGGFTLDSTEIK